MARFGFVGPTYASQSVIADCQRCFNWYPENVESGQGKSQMALYPTPGLSVFATGNGPLRGELAINGRVFWVGGLNLYEATNVAYAGEVAVSATATNRGTVGNDLQPVSMVTNGSAGNQILICSAGALYVFNLSTNTLTPVGGLQGIPSIVEFCNGYGIAVLANSNKFQVSNLLDFTTWNPLGMQQVQEFSENIGGVKQAFNQLFFLGADGRSAVYYDSGANQFTPFDVVPGAIMEEGIDAPWSTVVLDNTVFWIGGNRNGNGIAWRANGYTPLRISNHAAETAWATYPSKGSDAIGYGYRDQGHTFWVLRFPSANGGFGATWVYDVATQMWHERGFWSQLGPTGYSAHLSTCHCFAFGQHLVGDWNSGNVYAMSIYTYQDNGQAIRRFRRAPHISSEQTRIFHQQMQLDLEVGDGPEPPLLDGDGNPRGPQIMLRWSDDGGRTWGNEHWISAGRMGEYKKRAIWRRLGQSRDRVYEVAVTDPIPWRIVEAYLMATPGFQVPTERYSKQAAKMT